MRTAASKILYQLYTNIDTPIVLLLLRQRTRPASTRSPIQIVLEPVKTIANVVIDVAFPTFARLRSDRARADRAVHQVHAAQPDRGAAVRVLIAAGQSPSSCACSGSARHGEWWTPHDVELCVDAARILCVVGFFRALGYLGPPLLDGIGRPELTLRYMIVATIAVPGSFVLGAKVLGDRTSASCRSRSRGRSAIRSRSRCSAYLVIHTIELPVREYFARIVGHRRELRDRLRRRLWVDRPAPADCRRLGCA